MALDEILDALILREGDYSNDPNDSGGATRWGISETVAKENGYIGSMKLLPKDVAKQIYIKKYWLEPKFDQIGMLSQPLAIELFDAGVNSGTGFAVKTLQDTLNLLNRQGADYPDMVVDGSLGPKSMSALATFLHKRGKDGETILLRMVNIIKGYHYIEICKKNPTQEQWLNGWVLNRIH